MRTLFELVENRPHVAVVLKNNEDMEAFFKQAEKESFVLKKELPENYNCNIVMKIYSDHTMDYCEGTAAWMCVNHSVSVDFEKYMNGDDDYILRSKD